MLNLFQVSPHCVTCPHRSGARPFLAILLFVCIAWQGPGTAAGNAPLTQEDVTLSQVGPGIPQVGAGAPRSAASSTKPGSLLFFPKYTSDAVSTAAVNTLLTITNTNPRDAVAVRVFFVHDCVFEDLYVTLVANQSRTLLASRESPGRTGYAFAVAVNSQGLPAQFNWLIGSAILRDRRGHEGGYNAFAVAKRSGGAVRLNEGGGASDLVFDNAEYDRLPKRVAADSLQNQDEVAGPAVKTDVAIVSPMRNLRVKPADPFKLVATAYDSVGKVYPDEFAFACSVDASVGEIWKAAPFNSIISHNRPGWAGFGVRSGAEAAPVIGVSFTDGAAAPLHNVRVMQVLEWLDVFRMTIPIRFPDNPVADVLTPDQPESSGAEGAGEAKAGSLLFYPRFVSGELGAAQLYLTNTHPTEKVRLRVFFSGLVSPAEVKETILSLPPQQTVVLQANDHAPNQRGWAMVMAVNSGGLPIQFNHLIGSAQVSETGGLRASFNALAVAKNTAGAVGRGSDAATANLLFDDVNYDRLPATTAMAFVTNQADNATTLGLSRAPASLLDPPITRAVATVTLHDEMLASFSASLSRTEMRLNQIRASVLTPPITNTIQPGQSGWLKLLSNSPVMAWSLNRAARPFTTAANGAWRGGFSGDGNLHVLTTAESYTLNVPATNPNNAAPVAVAETIGLQVEARRVDGTIVRLDGSASSDPDAGDVLAYKWQDNGQPVSTARIADRRLALGSHALSLVVTDASEAPSTPADQTVSVVDTTPPQLSGIPSAVAKVSDADEGDVVVFASPVAYDMVDGNVAVTASRPSGSVFPFGKTLVAFTARDRAGNESRATMEVTLARGESAPQTGGVAGDKAPTMENLNDQYVKRGFARNVVLQAADPDGDPVTFSLQGAPAYVQIISGDPAARTATLRIAPASNETTVGTLARIIASDGKGQTFSTLPFRIFLSDVPNDDSGSGLSNNQAPVAVVSSLPAAIQANSRSGAELRLDASGSRDPENDPMTFSWYDGDTLLGRGAVLPVVLAVGTHAIRLTVFDGKDGQTTAGPFAVLVQPRALTISSVTPGTLDKNTTPTLTIAGTGFSPGSILQFTKEGVSVTTYTSIEEDKIVAVISIAATATPGFRDVQVINPNGTSVRLRSALFVNR
jgi:HYR domain